MPKPLKSLALAFVVVFAAAEASACGDHAPLDAAWSGTLPNAEVAVEPLAGPAGSPVTVSARDLTPGETVVIGVGPAYSEWSRLGQAKVAEDGSVFADLLVPGGYQPGTHLVFAIDPPRGDTLLSGFFEIEGESPTPGTPRGLPDDSFLLGNLVE